MHDLDEALEYLLEHEGGWSNHAADRGGATMYGVTQATYNAYCKQKGKTSKTVRGITKDEVVPEGREFVVPSSLGTPKSGLANTRCLRTWVVTFAASTAASHFYSPVFAEIIWQVEQVLRPENA